MSAEVKSAPILVLARDASLRRSYEGRLTAAARAAVAADPSDLSAPGRWTDACAAVVAADARSLDAILDAAPRIRELAVAPSLLFVFDALEEERLAAALELLRPAAAFAHPVPDALLCWALDSLTAGASGRGAREQHRPARALLGVSSAIRKLMDELGRIADSRVPILVFGETGTGKELVARAVHARSARARHPFVAVNCGAFAETLLESELFGHVKGAFTGATRDRAGLFEEADGGTLFLDEVAEMTPALQVKLLRVLETGEVRRIGSNRSSVVDVRVVSATHRDLDDAIEAGEFRQDLFYRLNAAILHLPPLRRRRVDIPFLAQHFAEEFGRENARHITLGEDFLDALSQRDFPGNVRELRNAVERAIALAATGTELGAEDLPPDPHGRPALYAMGTLADRIAQVEIQAIREALERFEGNKTRAAETLGISRLGLRKKMQRLGLS